MSYKVLGQGLATSPAGTKTYLYTVPAATEAVVSSLTACNLGATGGTFSVGVRTGAVAEAEQQYLYNDVEIAGNSTFALTGGVTLGPDQRIVIGGSTTDLAFSVFGQEVASSNGYKILGQWASISLAMSNQTLYTVPAGRQVVVSSLVVCNYGTSPSKFRVAVRPGGAALANNHYIYYDAEAQGNSTFVFTGGMTLASSDIVTVYANSFDLAFNLFGKEIT